MKYITFLFLSIFLVSCGQAEQKEIKTSEEQTNLEIETELALLSDSIPSIESQEPADGENIIVTPILENIKKIQTKYNNPAGEVIINIQYSLDTDGKITAISTTSDYEGNDYLSAAVQVMLGKTLTEAIDTDISGGSLTSGAFKKALKEQSVK